MSDMNEFEAIPVAVMKLWDMPFWWPKFYGSIYHDLVNSMRLILPILGV